MRSSPAGNRCGMLNEFNNPRSPYETRRHQHRIKSPATPVTVMATESGRRDSMPQAGAGSIKLGDMRLQRVKPVVPGGRPKHTPRKTSDRLAVARRQEPMARPSFDLEEAHAEVQQEPSATSRVRIKMDAELDEDEFMERVMMKLARVQDRQNDSSEEHELGALARQLSDLPDLHSGFDSPLLAPGQTSPVVPACTPSMATADASPARSEGSRSPASPSQEVSSAGSSPVRPADRRPSFQSPLQLARSSTLQPPDKLTPRGADRRASLQPVSLSVLPKPPDDALGAPLTPGRMSFLLPEVSAPPTPRGVCFANLRAGHTIGCGSFGRVFVAQDNVTGQLIAVKELLMGSGAASRHEQLVNELAVFEDARHPHVVQFFGHELVRTAPDEPPDRLFLYMEYLTGGTVRSQVTQFGPLADKLLVKYTQQMLLALVYLHSRSIVHRDLKTSNLLLTAGGDVKLADFGCSKRLMGVGGEECPNLKEVGTVVGSLPFIAPEVLAQQPAGANCDVWSLGGCALEMATAQLPWSGCSLDNVLHAYTIIVQKKDDPVSPALDEELKARPELRDFLRQCFIRDVEERPSANDMLQHAFVRMFS